MTLFLHRMWIIARRDFLSIVATPTFLLFLLAPMFMLGFGTIGGLGATQMADSARTRDQMIVVADPADIDALRAADRRLRAAMPAIDGPPMLVIQTARAGEASRAATLTAPGRDTWAVMQGPLTAPTIQERNRGGASGRYLAALADQVLRDRAAGQVIASRPTFAPLASVTGPSAGGQQQLGFAAVFVLFLFTLLLAGQAVGMLAEEKGNKVIEILAAAVPLEAVFTGKLVGLLGVAAVFIAFWGGLASIGALAVANAMPLGLTLAPAIGWPLFILFGLGYFTMAFLLLGAIFLGIGAQASTVREIQMLSLPITLLQVGMFALASAAANAPGTGLARIAQILPFSSPFAMAARGATDASIAPHLLALVWQGLWVALTVAIAVRLFRSGVLNGGGLRLWRRRRSA